MKVYAHTLLLYLLSLDENVLKTFYNSDYTFSSRVYGSLDVDLTHIVLPHPLGVLVQEPRLYIRETVPQLSFIALMNLHEVRKMFYDES